MIKVLFFASLAEKLSCDELEWTQPVADVAQLRQQLAAQGEPWQILLDQSQTWVAVQQQMATEQTQLELGNEVAFFPPVTGG